MFSALNQKPYFYTCFIINLKLEKGTNFPDKFLTLVCPSGLKCIQLSIVYFLSDLFLCALVSSSLSWGTLHCLNSTAVQTLQHLSALVHGGQQSCDLNKDWIKLHSLCRPKQAIYSKVSTNHFKSKETFSNTDQSPLFTFLIFPNLNTRTPCCALTP